MTVVSHGGGDFIDAQRRRRAAATRRGRGVVRAAALPTVEFMETRIMLSAVLNPASYASLGNFEPVPGVYTVDTTAGTISGPNQTEYSAVNSNGIQVFDFSNVNIGSGVTIQASGAEPWAILSTGSIAVDGTIDNDGQSAQDFENAQGVDLGLQTADRGGPGGGAGGVAGSDGAGAGPGVGADGDIAAGGGAFGGNGGAGGDFGSPGSAGGVAYGNLASPLTGGSGGGGGSNEVSGGGGGGGFELSASSFVDIGSGATITANGGNGAVDFFGASGGGSGGEIVIAGLDVNLAGTVTANGGEGGDGGSVSGGGGGGGGIVDISAGTYVLSGNLTASAGDGDAYSTSGLFSPSGAGADGNPGLLNSSPNASVLPLLFTAPATAVGSDISLSLDPAYNIQIYDYNSQQVLDSIPEGDVSGIQIAGAPNQNNALTVDYSNGFFITPITFDGGAGTGAHSLDVIAGTNQNVATDDVYTPGPSLGAGSLTLAEEMNIAFGAVKPAVIAKYNPVQNIQFVNLSPVLDTVPGSLTVNGTNANDVITYSQGIQDATDDGLVTVNNLESIEFSNKSTLAIDTGLGNDTFIDDQPANVPAGLYNPINLVGGDANNLDTLVYDAVPDSQATLIPYDPGAGELQSGSIDAQSVSYSGVGQINFNGVLSQGETLDVEGEIAAVNDFTVTPATGVGAGTITGTLDTDPFDANVGDATYSIPTITYAGLSQYLPSAAIEFGDDYPAQIDEVVYNALPGSGDSVNIYDDSLIDGYQSDEYQSIYIASDLGSYQVNLGSDATAYVTAAGAQSVYVNISGTGIGSADALYFDTDGNGDVSLNPDGQFVQEEGGSEVSYSGISDLNVNAEGANLNLSGAANVTVTPTDAESANISAGAGSPAISITNVGGAFTIDPDADANSVTIDATADSDSIVASGGADPVVQVDALLPVAFVAADTGMLKINGGAGDNNLAVDSTDGAFAIPITFNGGPGNNNSLTLTGGSEDSDVYVPGPLAGAGSVNLDMEGTTETVEFSHLAPVNDSIPGPLTVSPGGAGNNVIYSAGSDPSLGKVSVNSYEPIIFTNKTTLAMDAGNGNDAVTINNANTPTGLTAVSVTGAGLDTMLVNANYSDANVAAPGQISISHQPVVDYAGLYSISVVHVNNSIVAYPVKLVGVEGQALKNVSVGTFKGGPAGAVASNFTASINWGDGTTSAGVVTSSNGMFAVAGTHTYPEAGNYSPVVTITDPANSGMLYPDGVPITLFYGAPLNAAIDDSAHITDPNLIVKAITSPVDTPLVDVSTGMLSVATFTDPGGVDALQNYSASITWGDGHVSAGVITESGGVFTVKGANTYAKAGVYSPVVTVSHGTSTPQTVTDTHLIDVVDGKIAAGSTVSFSGTTGRADSPTVASFFDVNAAAPQSEFSATINWGDGTAATAGTIVSAGGGHFSVVGTHTYLQPGSYTATITVKDNSGDVLTIKSAGKIAVAPLELPTGTSFSVTTNKAFTNKVIGSFRDDDATNTNAAEYSGTINWGDGTTSSATFVLTSSNLSLGSYWNVEGSHTYKTKKGYAVTVTIHNVAAPSSNIVISTTITST